MTTNRFNKSHKANRIFGFGIILWNHLYDYSIVHCDSLYKILGLSSISKII